jgi:hypothetical protein
MLSAELLSVGTQGCCQWRCGLNVSGGAELLTVGSADVTGQVITVDGGQTLA